MLKNKTIKHLVTSLSVLCSVLLPQAIQAKEITHTMGTIEINQTPKRVVVLGHGSLDILDELAVKPVGVVKPLLPHFISQYAGNEYETVGSLKEPNFESIYMLKPDIIIAEGRQAAMYKELSQIAPTYLFQIDNKDYWKTTQHHWRVLGDIFDKQNIAESLIKNTDERMQNVHILASKENLRTLAVMNNGNNLAMYGEQSRFSIIFEDFGFKSASAPSTKPTDPHGNLISFEYIAQAKPDAMIILDREQAIGTSNGRAQALFDNALVHSTPAYKHEKMVFMDPAAWYLSAGGYKATHIMIDDVESVL
ncbi:siderophore ABC transporter substrate-binding protein [Vibrio breoganii]|uniref:siderophore ABC transporter substrate-binding protein n=1 Tax=Vibrio breoganii TaxID=553239 RepID=UPI0018E4D095|nr:siderophore ABC transporter substrate-binding protein [Vibrio breoganii]